MSVFSVDHLDHLLLGDLDSLNYVDLSVLTRPVLNLSSKPSIRHILAPNVAGPHV